MTLATTTADYGDITLQHVYADGAASTTISLTLHVGADGRTVPADRWADVQAAALSVDPAPDEALRTIFETL
jgi:hypothetical protein